jgi:hypothetical protein
MYLNPFDLGYAGIEAPFEEDTEWDTDGFTWVAASDAFEEYVETRMGAMSPGLSSKELQDRFWLEASPGFELIKTEEGIDLAPLKLVDDTRKARAVVHRISKDVSGSWLI